MKHNNLITRKVLPVGQFVLFCHQICRQALRPPIRINLICEHLYFIGNQSLVIILITGFFTGSVFALQIGNIFSVFRAEGMTGGATGLALATELAPLISGFLLSGRVGSAITAEIASMKVNEQIEAMESMGVNPIHYLVVPRVIASAIMMPLLCGLFMLIGIIGAYLIGIVFYDVDQGIFMERLINLVNTEDILQGLRKTFFFGIIIAAVSCRQGLQVSGGAKGVGNATTNSVVISLVSILFMDFVMSYIEVRWFG